MTNIRVIDEANSIFPAVSFCNLNPFTNDSLNYTGAILDNELKYATLNINNSLRLNSLNFLNLIQANLSTRSDEFKRSLSYTFDESVISCTFNQAKCSEAHFDWYYDRLLGNCYRFNSLLMNPLKNLSKTYKPGLLNGLQMEMFLGLQDKMPYWIYAAGLNVFVHENSVLPSPDEGINISPGFETNIDVLRQLNKNLPQPFTDCLNENEQFKTEFYKITTRLNQTYRQRSVCLFDLEKKIQIYFLLIFLYIINKVIAMTCVFSRKLSNNATVACLMCLTLITRPLAHESKNLSAYRRMCTQKSRIYSKNAQIVHWNAKLSVTYRQPPLAYFQLLATRTI